VSLPNGGVLYLIINCNYKSLGDRIIIRFFKYKKIPYSIIGDNIYIKKIYTYVTETPLVNDYDIWKTE
jgi:hypothetical protein